MNTLRKAVAAFVLPAAFFAGHAAVSAQPCEVVLRERQSLEQPYQGECLNGKAHGIGRYATSSVDGRGQPISLSYEGEFRAGMLHGQATRKDSRSGVFSGMYQNNLPNGPGAWKTPTFEEKGEYRNGLIVDGFRWLNRPDGGRLVMRMVDGKQVAQCHSARDSNQEKDCSQELLARLKPGVADTPGAGSGAGAGTPVAAFSADGNLVVLRKCKPGYSGGLGRVVFVVDDDHAALDQRATAEQATRALIPEARRATECDQRLRQREMIFVEVWTAARSSDWRSCTSQADVARFSECMVHKGAKTRVYDKGSSATAFWSADEQRVRDAERMQLEQERKDRIAQRQADEAREAAAQRAEETRRVAERDSKAQALADRFGASGWAPWSQLQSNPFAHEGKVYLFNTKLEQMLTPTSGVFRTLVLVNVPRGTFTDGREVVIAGRVIGADKVQVPMLGERQVPKVHFLGHVFCSEPSCKDFGSLRGR